MNRSACVYLVTSLVLSLFSTVACTQENTKVTVLPEQKHHLMFHAIKDVLPKIHYEGLPVDANRGSEWLKALVKQIDQYGVVFSKKYLSGLFEEYSGEDVAYRLNALDLESIYPIINKLYEHKRKALESQLQIASKLKEDAFNEELIYSHNNFLSKIRSRPINERHRSEVFRRIVASDVAFKMQEGFDFADAKEYVLERLRERLIVLNEISQNSEHYFTIVTHSLLQSFDKHSRYIAAKDITTLKASQQNKDYEIGIELSEKEGELTVTNISKGSPAERSGEWAIGDVVTAIVVNDKFYPLANKTKAYLHDLISKVDSNQSPLHFYCKRGQIEYKSVIHREPTDRGAITIEKYRSPYHHQSVDVMKIPSFFNGMAEQISSALSSQTNRLLVIDLRGNGGGALIEAINATSLFMDGGEIVSIKDKSNHKVFSDEDSIYLDKELIMLVDRETASAAEIMASALQYHQEAVIVGEQTFGKGSVQQFIDFSDPRYNIPYSSSSLGGMLVTVSKYFTPNGKTLEGTGLIPDVGMNLDYKEDHDLDDRKAMAQEISNALVEMPLYRLHVKNMNSVEDAVDTISLDQLVANQLADNKRSLWYINLNRKYQGLPPVEALSGLEDDYETIDIILDAVAKVSPPA